MGKTVIVGGGTAGLAAAYTLDRAGADYSVLEKRDFSGGRIYGKVVQNSALDLGAQFMFTRYATTFDLVDKLKAKDQLVKFRPWMGIYRNDYMSTFSMNMLDNLSHPIESAKGALNLLGWSGRLRAPIMGAKFLALARKLDFDDPLKAIELDNITYADYTRKFFGSEILEYVSQPVASTLSLGIPEEISAAYGMALAWYMAPGLLTFKSGIGYLAERMSEEVKDNLKLNTTVKKIIFEGKKVMGVEIANGDKSEFIEADNVICSALAPQAAVLLEDALPKSIIDVLASIKYSACTHVMFGVPGRPLGKIYAVATPRKLGLCFSGITENAVKASGYAPPDRGIIHAFTYADYARDMLNWTDEDIKKRVLRDIRIFNPSFPEPLFTEIFRWPEAVCLCMPGQIGAVQKLKVALREYEGLHLTGEYMGLPSMEAALHFGVQSGERVLATS